MRDRDLRFASWVISITSILYGLVSIIVLTNNGYSDGYYGWEIINKNYLQLIPFVLLIVFGISKVMGIIFNIKLLKRVSIVGMMFSWGFIWTSSLVSFIVVGPNRTSITIIPIIAISAFIAMRGDYSDD